MLSLEQRILVILRAKNEPLDVKTLLERIKTEDEGVREAQVRAALFPLMNTGEVKLSRNDTVECTEKALAASAN